MELINALSSPETQMNGNFQTLEWAQVYGRRAEVTTGLTWGYYGGVMWGGVMVADGTLTLTNAAANYIVVNKTTGVISVSTAATNWNDTATYARVYKVTTAAGVVSAVEDHRAGQYGILAGLPGSPGPAGPAGPTGPEGPQGPAGTGGVVFTQDAEPAGTIDGNQWFESDTGNLYLRYQNPDASYTWIHTNAGTAGQSGGSVNAIINGDMMIWQRGTSFTTGNTADRWGWAKAGAAVHTITRATSVPTVAQAGRLFSYSLSVNCTTADTSIAADDLTILQQAIEGYNWIPCAQRACTLSFWVMASKTGVYCISLNSGGVGDRSFVAEYTINAANTWEFKVIAIPPSPAAGTWNYTNGVGAYVRWMMSAGSNFRTTAGAWQAGGPFLVTVNQVNATDAVNNTFYLTGVDLRPGTFTAPQFVSRSFGEELALCQRYYEKTFKQDVAPAAGTNDTADALFGRAYTTGAAEPMVNWDFATAKRTLPTVTLYNLRPGGAAGQWTDQTTDSTAARIRFPSEHRVAIDNTGNLLNATAHWFIAATADAEL